MQQQNAELQQQLQSSQEQLRILQEMLKASEQVPLLWFSGFHRVQTCSH